MENFLVSRNIEVLAVSGSKIQTKETFCDNLLYIECELFVTFAEK